MDSRIGWGGEPFVWQRRVVPSRRVGQAFTEAQMIRAARARMKSLKSRNQLVLFTVWEAGRWKVLWE
jgi:hypothetical protein